MEKEDVKLNNSEFDSEDFSIEDLEFDGEDFVVYSSSQMKAMM